MNSRRISDFGVTVGRLPRGPLSSITDVPGVTVGHSTLCSPALHTGVTVVIPAPGDLFKEKVVGAACVLNGFGKTQGLVQVDELGSIETPIFLTNTLNVGKVHDAAVQYMVSLGEKNGYEVHSVNPIVAECNDADLNDIRARAVGAEDVFRAIESASREVREGNVGAGAGTTCHSLKGGIGTASRVMTVDGRDYTLGALVQTNHGLLRDLRIDGRPVGERIGESILQAEQDKGSCIVVIGTDLPLSDRQLKRVCRRAMVGLARAGSYLGHGSGEIVIGFSNANRIRHDEENGVVVQKIFNENKMDLPFRACAEAVEEAILNSLAAAETTVGYRGEKKAALGDLWEGF